MLIIYFAGFATAIYALAPSEAKADTEQKTVFSAGFNSNQVAARTKQGIDKCLSFAKSASMEASKMIKDKIAEVELQKRTSE
jgi:hypothetical protein